MCRRIVCYYVVCYVDRHAGQVMIWYITEWKQLLRQAKKKLPLAGVVSYHLTLLAHTRARPPSYIIQVFPPIFLILGSVLWGVG